MKLSLPKSAIARALSFAVALVVTGCGSGGGGGGGTPSTPTPTSGTTATLTLVIPPASTQSNSRRPEYISPATTAIQIVIDNVNGSTSIPAGFAQTTTVQLTSNSGGPCSAATSTGETCTVQVPAPAGNIVYTFTIMNAAGQPLATAKKAFTITKGQSNDLSVVLGGIVASVKILVPALLAGVKSVGTLQISAYDASHDLIDASAPYATPIILTDTDQTLSTHLDVRNTIGPTAQVNSASDVVTFIYNGNVIPAFAINATVGTTTVGTSGPIVPSTSVIAFSNTFLDTIAPGDPNYEQPTIFFGTVGTPSAPVTSTTTASEVGYSGTFTATLDPVTCGGPVASITPTTGTTFTVTSLNPGICKVTVDDTIGHQSLLWISVTTGVVSINAHGRVVK